MAFTPHYRLTALGRLGDSGERFSYGISIGEGTSQTALPPLGPPSVFAALETATRAFHARGGTGIAEQAVLETVKVAPIGPDGKYSGDPLFNEQVTSTNGGAANSGYTIPQAALAVSLVTGRRGASGRGRFYVPMPCLPIQVNTMLLGQTALNGMYESVRTWLQEVEAAVAAPNRVVVASTLGGNAVVTAIRVGRVIDTIRSRRTSIDEGYQAPVLVHP